MPHLRQRMRSRRSSSRGRAIRSRSTSSSDSSSEDFSHGHYPETWRKWGRATLAGYAHPIHGSQYHDAASPSQPVTQHFATHVSTPPAQIALRKTSNRAQFQVSCIIKQPVITAFITVTLREEAAGKEDKDDSKEKSAPMGMESASKEKESMNEAAGKATCETTEDEDGSNEEYRCRIEEEPPSPANDK